MPSGRGPNIRFLRGLHASTRPAAIAGSEAAAGTIVGGNPVDAGQQLHGVRRLEALAERHHTVDPGGSLRQAGEHLSGLLGGAGTTPVPYAAQEVSTQASAHVLAPQGSQRLAAAEWMRLNLT